MTRRHWSPSMWESQLVLERMWRLNRRVSFWFGAIRDVARVIRLSGAIYRKMIQTLVQATVYNLVAIPVASGLFVH
jgi:hypothetical protein